MNSLHFAINLAQKPLWEGCV